MAGGSHRRAAFAAFLSSIALVALGFFWQAGPFARDVRTSRGRLLVVGVRGMSWQTLLDRSEDQHLPRFRRRLEGKTADADIISIGYSDPGAVLASVLTGKLGHKHGVQSFRDADRFRAQPASPHRPLWELLARRGHRVAVVGFPFWAPIAAADGLVVPDASTFSARGRVWAAGRESNPPARWASLRVDPEEVPRPLLDRVLGGASISPELTETLRAHIAADLGMLAIASEIAGTSPETHVFLYLEGLKAWERRVRREAPTQAATLVAGYHEVVEPILECLEQLDSPETTFVLFSEEGNRGRAITYRRGFPSLPRWPPVGWLVAWGRAIEPTVEPLTLAPVDLTPTLLHITGNPVPNDMDGIVAFELLHDDFCHKHRVSFVASY